MQVWKLLRVWKLLQVWKLLCLLGILSISFNADAQPKPSGEGCQAAPDQQGSTGTMRAPGKEATSETMEKCGGVLKPPATGDKEMAVPAPDQGKTPVIPPEQVPQQQPK